jgi:hypothetical protein
MLRIHDCASPGCAPDRRAVVGYGETRDSEAPTAFALVATRSKAEGVGFEPTSGSLLKRFSRPPPSATRRALPDCPTSVPDAPPPGSSAAHRANQGKVGDLGSVRAICDSLWRFAMRWRKLSLVSALALVTVAGSSDQGAGRVGPAP